MAIVASSWVQGQVRFVFGVALLALLGCGNPAPNSPQARAVAAQAAEQAASAKSSSGVAVTPPFAVRDDATGLMLVWYDDHGEAHPATQRDEIPEAQRASVRVDALELAPEQRLDPAFVYVADLREAGKDGTYAVRKVERDAFEASLPSAAPAASPSEGANTDGTAHASSDVIIYGASWCGACKQAARFFTQKGVPFVEKDIEKEPEARSEMLAKAKSQGVRTGGIPVIDVHGTLLGGFNAQRIEQLLAN